MKFMKFCPLIKEQCKGTGCAWYDPIDEECAIYVIAQELNHIDENLDRL